MDIRFDPDTKTYSNNEGVSIRPKDFGGMGAFTYLAKGIYIHHLSAYMEPWIKWLEGYGYEVGKSLRGASYDWRMGPKEWEQNEDWGFPAFKSLVEEMYVDNGNKSVHMMGHSLGCATAGYFLSSFVTQEWKDKYIASFIPLGGPFDGSFEAPFLNIVGFTFYQLFKPDPRWNDILKNIGGTQWMTPSVLGLDEPFLITKDKPEGYTMNDYQQLMSDANSSVSYDIYEWEKTAMRNLAPGVPTHCLYGWNLPTAIQFYIDDLLNPVVTNATKFTNGDTTVHEDSLTICDGFADLQTQPVEVIRYNGLSHIAMTHNLTVWEDVLKITSKQKKEVK